MDHNNQKEVIHLNKKQRITILFTTTLLLLELILFLRGQYAIERKIHEKAEQSKGYGCILKPGVYCGVKEDYEIEKEQNGAKILYGTFMILTTIGGVTFCKLLQRKE